jgi:hypothetical protein
MIVKEPAGFPSRRRGGRGLDEAAGDVPGFDEEEHRDLGDVRPGRDVDQVVLAGRVERRAPREIPQGAVGLLQIPGVGEGGDLQVNVGLG